MGKMWYANSHWCAPAQYQKTALCIEQWEQQVQYEIALTARQFLQTRFLAYGEELERVEVFKYLGWLLA
jgi:hypothetical protein